MVEPVSAAVLAGVALTEGIKFLYDQAGEILSQRAERKRAEKAGQQNPVAALDVTTPSIVQGHLAPLTIDDNAADRLAGELIELRRRLDVYAAGYEDPPAGDRGVLASTFALRDAIEDIVGQRITFVGESRDPTGTPVATGRIDAKDIRGKATAVDISEMTEGRAQGEVTADRIEAGAEVAATRVKKLGR